MSDVPPHVEQKWKAVERKAQVPGMTFSRLREDFEDALRTYLDWWLSEMSVKQLAQTDNRKD